LGNKLGRFPLRAARNFGAGRRFRRGGSRKHAKSRHFLTVRRMAAARGGAAAPLKDA
jgi:hypothetical protein